MPDLLVMYKDENVEDEMYVGQQDFDFTEAGFLWIKQDDGDEIWIDTDLIYQVNMFKNLESELPVSKLKKVQ